MSGHHKWPPPFIRWISGPKTPLGVQTEQGAIVMRGAYEIVDQEYYYDGDPNSSTSKELKRQMNFPLLKCPVCLEEWPGFKGDVGSRCPWNECGQGQVQQLFYRYVDDMDGPELVK